MPPLGIQIGISGGSSTSGGFNPSDPGGGFTGILDTYTGAAAAYSVRRLSSSYTGGLIRVRRSSDDAEQDIGYDANGEDLDTFGLLAFVNEDYNAYTSDFSGGTDGWFENGGTADGDIDGISDGTTSKDDVLRLTLSGGATNHSVRLNGAIDLGNVHNVSFDYYIPSGQTMDGIKFQTSSGLDGNYQQSVVGTWTSVTISDWSITGGNQFRVYAMDGGDITVDADGDVFYLKNIVVTQTTADGHVTTWYDQTGNGNDANNSTASEQPLIVEAGDIIYEGATLSRPAVDFDGVDDNLLISSFTSTLSKLNSHSTIVLNKSNSNTGNLLSSAVDTNDRFTVGYNAGFLGIMIYQSPFLRNSTSSSSAFGSQTLISNYFDTASASTYVDGVEVTTDTSMQSSSTVQTTIGSRNGGGIHLDGNIQEMIIFDSDQSANRGTVTAGGGTDIEGNINTYFDIV